MVIIYCRLGWAEREQCKTFSSPESYFGGIPTPLPNVTAMVTIFISSTKEGREFPRRLSMLYSAVTGFKSTM